jgi:maleamate amidohydrolase
VSDAERDRIYERAGWGQRIRRGTRPGIVVVDLTNGFTDPDYPTGSELSEVVANTGRLLEAAREHGRPVVFTTIGYAAHGLDGNAWLQKAPGLAVLKEGTPAAELDPRLPRGPEDVVIGKKGASAFFGTNLAAVLVGAGVDTVVICGATTSGCVRASAVDSVQSGFPTLVVRECVGDRAPGPHEANLFDIDAKYGDVISLEDALAYVAAPEPVPAASRAELPAEY